MKIPLLLSGILKMTKNEKQTKDYYLKNRTCIHEAGHALVLWDVFSVICPNLLSTTIYDESTDWNVTGFASLGDYGNIDVPDDAKKLMAVFYAGKVAVKKAIEYGLLEKDFIIENEPGFLGFSKKDFSNFNILKPSTDYEHIEFLAKKHEIKDFHETTYENLKIEAENISERSIDNNWECVKDISNYLYENQYLCRNDLRDIILNKYSPTKFY